MSAIVIFDIRKFSTHMQFLTEKRETQILANVVRDILNTVVDTVNAYEKKINFKSNAIMNHTGDGFIAVFYGRNKGLFALLVASNIRQQIEDIISEYNEQVRGIWPDLNLPDIGYGMGIDIGEVRKFSYRRIEDPSGSKLNVGFLGHSINVASRVEQASKDHVYNVICTGRIYQEALKNIKDQYKKQIVSCFQNIGEHKLEGLSRATNLYHLKMNFHTVFKEAMQV